VEKGVEGGWYGDLPGTGEGRRGGETDVPLQKTRQKGRHVGIGGGYRRMNRRLVWWRASGFGHG